MTIPPLLVLSMGDPAGIGPEVIIKALQTRKDLIKACRIAVVGDEKVLAQAARICQSRIKVAVGTAMSATTWDGKNLTIINPLAKTRPVRVGKWSKASGEQSYLAVKHAAEMVWQNAADALVTAPICKEAWHAAGVRFSGHTEMLAELTHTRDYAMMFVNGPFRVILVTIHVALAQVPKMITRARVMQTILRGATELRQHFGIRNPRIAVAGLNPHAGESGLFGHEEQRVIAPALAALRKKPGWTLTGPLPPDTLFTEAGQGAYDLVVCMYHDQGLIPFKMLALHQGVNVTAGLPIIRTSPDHGTAFSLAGTGRAQAGSMAAAIRIALDMVQAARKKRT